MMNLDQAEVDRNFDLLTRRRVDGQRRQVAAQNAVIARQVAQSFGEHAKRLRDDAASRGSEIDHAVAMHLVRHCESNISEYIAIAAAHSLIAHDDAS